MTYCCKDYKNVQRGKTFLRSRFFVSFGGFVNSFWNIRSFFNSVLKCSISPKYKKLFKSVFCFFCFLFFVFVCLFFFLFLTSESYFLKYKRNIRLEGSISRNITKFLYARVLSISLLKYKKSSVSWKLEKLFLKKYKKLFQSRLC